MSVYPLDLKAARCPSAMSYVRMALNAAQDKKFTGQVLISTIEQSMPRDLEYFVSTLNSVSLVKTESKALSEDVRKEWLSSGEAVVDELEGIESITIFTVNIG